MTLKSVLIIGAGPSGLVAAKNLLHKCPSRFQVTIMEKQDRVGGLWAVDRHSVGTTLDPNMPTNGSKFIASFSDLSWGSVRGTSSKMSESVRNETGSEMYIDPFPRAWQVAKYIETYVDKYIPDGTILFRTEVVSAERVKRTGAEQWQVKFIKCNDDGTPKQGSLQEMQYDFLIVASGFFSEPQVKPFRQFPGFEDLPEHIKAIHSTKFRVLTDILPSRPDWRSDQRNVLVIGGSLSGAEAAAAAALEISNKFYAPGTEKLASNRKEVRPRVIHVTTRPFYIVTTFCRSRPNPPSQINPSRASSFVFNDVRLYDLADRPPDTRSFRVPDLGSQRARTAHGFLRSIFGDQKELHEDALVVKDLDETPYVGVSDTYKGFVRSGLIRPYLGRFVGFRKRESHEGGTTAVVVTDDGSEQPIDDVAGVIIATGFTPQPSLEFLENNIKQELGWDPESTRLPLMLQDASTGIPSIPNLGFVGFYEAPFWGVMEMQARILAHKWTSSDGGSQIRTIPDPHQEELARLRALKKGMSNKLKSAPQYWMGDYLALMDTVSRSLNLTKNELPPFKHDEGPVTPARYVESTTNMSEANSTLSELSQAIRGCYERGDYVPRVVFRELHGPWVIERKLFSRGEQNKMPSGIFNGTADFWPRKPTDETYAGEYLYSETGELHVDAGANSALMPATITASRKYVYRYEQERDEITTWFVKPQEDRTVDYIFMRLHFEEDRDRAIWIAKDTHPCKPDMYEGTYKFWFTGPGSGLERFEVTYRVRGPHKDYESFSTYTRAKGI